MKVVRARSLDRHDRSRFVELTCKRKIDVDAAREADYLAAAFNMGFVRQSWRTAKTRRRKKK